MKDVSMAYSIAVLTDEAELYGLRGRSGTWPLRVGESEDTILFSSETRIAKDPDIKWSEVQPGELVKATTRGVERKQLFEPFERRFQCSLMDAYGARYDSMMTDELTYGAFRELIGRKMAEVFPIEADMYVGIPETGLAMVQGYTQIVGKEPAELFKKNESIKSFIAKNNEEINDIIQGTYYLNPEIDLTGVESVVLLDDTMIRGNTSRALTAMLHEAGVRDVHWIVLDRFENDCD